VAPRWQWKSGERGGAGGLALTPSIEAAGLAVLDGNLGPCRVIKGTSAVPKTISAYRRSGGVRLSLPRKNAGRPSKQARSDGDFVGGSLSLFRVRKKAKRHAPELHKGFCRLFGVLREDRGEQTWRL